MDILVLGGTRFFGIPMVEALLTAGHKVTIATRGHNKDNYGSRVERLILDRNNKDSMKDALADKHFDVVIDKTSYCSNDIRYAMDAINCGRYILMSSTAVYEPIHQDSREEDFDAGNKELIWCNRADVSYDEGKQQAECALLQLNKIANIAAVRYPVVLGENDYTGRLLFYVEHVMKGKPMYIDNIDCQMGFIHSEEAGHFLAWLTEKEYVGPINGCSNGTISIREILDYVEKRMGRKAIIDGKGEPAPYNGTPAYSVNTDKAQELGFQFSDLKNWIYDLVDYCIECVGEGNKD